MRLGFTAFGGPVAHVALMEAEVVTRRKWVTRDEFMDLLAATNLIPGPNSTEMAIHLGHRRAGVPGLFVAGACFILPAALITAGFAFAYARYRTLPELGGLLYGLKPAILAIVGAAMVRLVLPRKKDALFLIVAAIAAAASLLGAPEVPILLAGGAVAASIRGRGPASRPPKDEPKRASPGLVFGLPALAGAAASAGSRLLPLGLFFLKVGSILYGSGYVLIAFLREGLVVERGWLSEAELLDAVAIGQFTPGPVLTTATFVGYLVEGPAGAVVATLAIFAPSFLFVLLSAPLIPRLRASRPLGALLDGVGAAALGLLVAAFVPLARGAFVGWPAFVIFLLAVPLAMQPKLNATWIVVGGAALGIAVRMAGFGG
ncbi:chromate efflux transporter [Polyangium aurulentum]|uniref:chromate efflux transporter n=1 Tax=Polyangium aurulentum TaxID=2567896 RepID=UPI00201045EF